MIIRKLNYYCFLALFLCAFYSSHGGQVDSELIQKNLNVERYSLDLDAAAIVLYESKWIEVRLVGNVFSQVEKVHEIIKILKPEGLHEADVKLYYQDYGGVQNFFGGLKGATYNLINGKMVTVPLNKTDIYTHEAGKGEMETSFTMPSAKEGSVIEYEYELSTGLYQMLPAWHIQSRLPKLYSRYSVSFPHVFNLISISHVSEPFKEASSTVEGEANGYNAYHIGSNSLGNMEQTVHWVKKNIPALTDEPFANDVINYNERLDVILQSSYFMTDNIIEKSWDHMNLNFWNSEVIGKQLVGRHHFLDDLVDSLTALDTSAEGRAKNIFKYVRNNFQCNNNSNFTFRKSRLIKNVYNNRSGSYFEINLFLMAMLRQAHINASPLLLSIKGSLPLSPVYPLVNRIAYMACVANVNNDTVFLDASEKYYPYNFLAPVFYNGFSWIVDSKGCSINLDNNRLKEKKMAMIQMSFDSDTSAKITVIEKLSQSASVLTRIAASKDTIEFQKDLKKRIEGLPDNAEIVGTEVYNLNNPDTNLVIKYSCTYHVEKNVNDYYVNAQLVKFFNDNPFKSVKRKLPIDFPGKMSYFCYENVKLPDNMKPDELPQPVDVNYGDGKMEYKQLTNYNVDTHTIIVNSSFNINEPQYDVANYETMKQFFETMVKTENSVLTVKKAN